MARKDQHVVKRPDGWAVRGAGNARDTSHHRTQVDAEAAAREIARNQRSDVVTHGRDGRIRSNDSYGNDQTLRRTESTSAGWDGRPKGVASPRPSAPAEG